MTEDADGRGSPAPGRTAGERGPFVVLVLLAGISVWAQQWVQKAKWLSLTTEWPLDLAFFHNLIWNLRHGFGWRQTATWHEKPGIFHETHFEPIHALCTPLFAALGTVDALFVTQAIVLASGVIALWRILRFGDAAAPWTAMVGAATWLWWWPLVRTAQADIRPLMWAAPMLLHLCAALQRGRAKEALLWAILASCCREEVPILVIAVGGLWAITHERGHLWGRRRGLGVAVAALLFLGVTTALRSNTTFYIRPGEWFAAFLQGGSDDGRWGHSAADLLPIRVRWLGAWVFPGAVTAVFAPEVLLAAGPLLVYLFSQQHEWALWEGPYIHHAAPVLGIVAAAAALGATRVARWIHGSGRVVPAWAGPLFAVLLACGVAAQSVAGWKRHTAPEVEPWASGAPDAAAIRRLAAMVPPDAPVMSDYQSVHLLAGRRWVWCYQQEEPENVAPGADFRGPLLPRAEPDPPWALIRDEHTAWVARAERLGYSVIAEGGGYRLWQLPGR